MLLILRVSMEEIFIRRGAACYCVKGNGKAMKLSWYARVQIGFDNEREFVKILRNKQKNLLTKKSFGTHYKTLHFNLGENFCVGSVEGNGFWTGQW